MGGFAQTTPRRSVARFMGKAEFCAPLASGPTGFVGRRAFYPERVLRGPYAQDAFEPAALVRSTQVVNKMSLQPSSRKPSHFILEAN